MTQHCSHVDSRGRNCRRPVSGDTGFCHFHKPHVPFPGGGHWRRTEEWATVNPYETIEAPKEIGRQQWDKVQQEEGWWDDALPDATPEEQMKEALANAEAAERRLSAEEIYTVASLGGEVTTEMFDPSISARFWDTVGGAVFVLVLCVVAPIVLTIADIAIFLGRIANFEFRKAFRGNPFVWAAIGVLFVWNPQFLIGAAILGAVWGFYDHWAKSRALKRGKSDFLESQEET